MDKRESGLDAKHFIIKGVVQGIGFRPYVARKAACYHISGTVKNIGGAVEVIARGKPQAMRLFLHALLKPDIPYAKIDSIQALKELSSAEIAATFGHTDIHTEQYTGFQIVPSISKDTGELFLLPDIGICPDCLTEIFDHKNRRYRYPFNSCTSCGPRFSIIDQLPYDRENTSMREFPMCIPCHTQYTLPTDRRCHAQTIGCSDCGPQLSFETMAADTKQSIGDEALTQAIETLLRGKVIAIKGIGGYHLACKASETNAVQTIRRMKGREKKPLAVLFPDIEAVEKYCDLSQTERAALLHHSRPIVLLREKLPSLFAPNVAGESNRQGCMLPYTALHALLTAKTGPLVMTSANYSGQPLLHEEAAIRDFVVSRKETLFGGICSHNRRILRQVDDSVVQFTDGYRQMVRLGRGFAPCSISVNTGLDTPEIIAYGGDLKASYCTFRNGQALVSHYFGDMEECAVREKYVQELKQDEQILHLQPTLAVCDLHPGYHTHALAVKNSENLMEVQHHVAHIASVAAEHGITEPCIGVAFDGTGYGEDGAIWGGEFFLWHGDGSYDRIGHLAYMKLVGADTAAKDAVKTASCMLLDYQLKVPFESDSLEIYRMALQMDVNTILTSSMGRLFDACAAILDVCRENSYEGRCGILLEQTAWEAYQAGKHGTDMSFEITNENGIFKASAQSVLRILSEATDVADAALGFHVAVANLIREICMKYKEISKKILLSGGVFQNQLLCHLVRNMLATEGFQVLLNEMVPAGDGGISLGQTYVAALRFGTAQHTCAEKR